MRKAIACFCFWQLAFVGILWAQANRATITGTVTDSSGAPMAGVEVTATNLGTNIAVSTVTNDDGIYSILNLFPGSYSLGFRKVGFKPLVHPKITLESTQVAQMNASLQLGEVTETVTVTTDAPVLDRESAAIGTNMKGNIVTDLPLSIYGGGRFVENFAVALTPGYSPYSSPYGAVVNGSQWFTKDYTIDGTSGTSSIRGDSMETGPSMEAVQELQAQTSGIESADAISNGGVMSFTLKSGTNEFHGSLFGYGHNEFLDANTWTNDLTGAPKTKARAWDYGASVGGPIRKDKLFFFGAFERYTQTDFTLGGFSPATTVPTTKMLSGDFSELLGNAQCTDSSGNMGDCGGSFTTPVTVQNKAGATVPLQKGMIFDPTTCNASGVCKQFTRNVIDTPLSSVSQKIVAIYQKDYAPQQPGLSGNDRFPLSNSPAQTPNQGVVKLDYTLTSKDKLAGSWILDHRPRTLVDSGGIWQAGSTDGGPLANARVQLVKGDQFRVSEARTLTPNLLNVLNGTYNWYWNGNLPASTGTNWNQQLGLGATAEDNFPTIDFGGAINGFGITNIGNKWQNRFVSATLITGDNLTWTKGRHTIAFGGDFWDYQVNSHSGSGIDSFKFIPNTTAGGFNNIAGFGFASFLLGDVSTAGQGTAFDLYGRRKSFDLYAQDSYKVTSKLTLTGGLRWQYSLRFHEKYGHWANFDLGQIDPKYGTPGRLVFPSNSGDSFETKEYWDGFGPQLGFAYSPLPRWVVRGSFSLTLLPPNAPQFDGVPDAFAPQYQGTNSVTSPFNWDGGYPGVFKPGSTSVDPSSFFGLVYTDPHSLMPGFADSFNVGVQYGFTPNLRLEVAYVGNRGHHLPDTALAWNEPSAATFLNVEKQNPGLVPYGDFSSWNFNGGCTKGGPVPSGFGFGPPYVGITCPYTGFSGPALAALAPSPQLADWSSAIWFFYDLYYAGLPIGQTSYNSMVVDLVKRTGRGLTMDVNYTYSRQRGDTYTSAQEYNAYYTPVQDFGNIAAAANSLTGYDLTHIVKGYVTYELPFGKGQRWLPDKRGLLNAVVGGWRANTIVLYTSGQPIHIGINQPFYPIWGTFYPNFTPNPSGPASPTGFSGAQSLSNSSYYYPYFAKSVATAPVNPSGTVVGFGSGGAYDGGLRCPGQANENASILKYFTMGSDGQYQLSVRVEFYNLFNRHYYAINGCGGTTTNIGDSNFAAVTGVNSTQRTGQFGLRFTF
jgi:Carboxypeptidase regulatory-like domain/TonB dependent receptor